jgi:hypothetical protein
MFTKPPTDIVRMFEWLRLRLNMPFDIFVRERFRKAALSWGGKGQIAIGYT